MVTVMTPAFRLISAGAVIVGITFGLARYGYGLLLPDLRAALELDSATLGLIGSGSIAAYLLATAVTGAIAARVCARWSSPAARSRWRAWRSSRRRAARSRWLWASSSPAPPPGSSSRRSPTRW